MKKPELVVRWSLGLLCLAIEVVVVSIVLAALSRNLDTDGLFFWHPVLMTIGVILFLSHGTHTRRTRDNRELTRCARLQA
jgi:hypothetical protein